MKKIISILLLVALFVGFSGVMLPQTVQAASVRNRKIVSVVYDDSGSMEGAKWEYTSYAMQCFAAMLNKEDLLNITYMNKGSYTVDTGKRAESVEEIRNQLCGGGTPATAIDAATNFLKSTSDSNPNTQYWLIVMTDGVFNEGTPEAKRKVDEIANMKMPNGTKPQIVYLTICDPDGSFTPSFNKTNIRSRTAENADEIIGVISDIACNISGRYPVDHGDIKVIDDTTIEVTSDLPLINIGILSQRSKAQVVSVEDKENNSLKNEGNVPVSAPGRYPGSIPSDAVAALNGNVALFSSANGNIPAGTYTIKFSEPVDKKDLVIMFEPAFELRLEVMSGGLVITDLSQLVEGATVDLEATLYEVGTDNKIAMSMLPSGYQMSISYAENGKIVKDDKSLKLTGIQLKPVETEINAVLEIPGFFTASDVVRFTPLPIVLSDMTADVHYDGSERMTDENGNPDGNDVVYIDRLDTNETGIAFKLEIEGEPIGRDKALAIQSLFEERLDTEIPGCEVSVASDGRLIVTPKDTWCKFILGDLVYFWIHGGEKTISCTYDGITAFGNLNFKLADEEAGCRGFIIRVIIIIIAALVIRWAFFKKHFPWRRVLIQVFTANRRNGRFSEMSGACTDPGYWSSSDPINFLNPIHGMHVHLEGTSFSVRAMGRGKYRVEGVENMRVSDNDPFPLMEDPCEKNYFDFSDEVFIAVDNSSFYKITVGEE